MLLNVLQCDRCGGREELPTGGVVRWATLKVQPNAHIENASMQQERCIATEEQIVFDICPACLEKLKAWCNRKG